MRLERTVHSAQQPANSQGNERCRVRLGFDRFAQPRVQGRRRVSRCIRGLAIQILGLAANLIGDTFRLGFCISGHPTNAFLYFPAEITCRSFEPVFIHGNLSFPRNRELPAKVPMVAASASVEPVAAARSFGYWTVRALLPALPDTHSEHKTRCRNENASSHRGRARRPVVRTCGDKTSPYRAPNAWLSAPDSLHRCVGVFTRFLVAASRPVVKPSTGCRPDLT